MRRIVTVLVLSFAPLAAVASLMLVACSDDPRPPIDDAATTEASLPEAATPVDAGDPDARDPFDGRDEPVVCDASVCVTELVAGEHHFCARTSDGKVRCWGDDAKGQRGLAPSDAGVDAAADGGGDASKPTVTTLGGITQISAAGNTTCARAEDGGVLCWGGNEAGDLGRGGDAGSDDLRHPVPARVVIEPAARVDVGERSSCATTAPGKVICWGEGPAPAELGLPVTRTAAGLDTGFALARDGTLLTWGEVAGGAGVLSGRISSVTPTPLASPVQGLSSISSFAVSGPTPGRIPPGTIPGSPLPPSNQHACAVMKGEIHCWGKSERGALGSGLPDAVIPLPTYARLATKAYAQQLAAGGETTCARLTDSTVTCTGENARGQLGTGMTGPFSSTFVPASTLLGRAVQVAVARESVCALMQGGEVACWGGNAHGELGLGAPDQRPHPSATKVPF